MKLPLKVRITQLLRSRLRDAEAHADYLEIVNERLTEENSRLRLEIEVLKLPSERPPLMDVDDSES